MEENKVSERRSGLLHSEKKLPERRYGVFRNKTTPLLTQNDIYFLANCIYLTNESLETCIA
jgi:hypothetical protein